MSEARILLVRHGESEWNAAGRWQGQADPPLSDEGRAQAGRAIAVARGLCDRIACSDLRRAHDTAHIIGAAIELSVAIDADLRERDIGAWSGLTMAEVEAGWPGHVARGLRPDDSEADDPMWERVSRALLRIASGGGTSLVVSHGGVIALTERKVGVRSGRVHNLEGLWIDVRDGAFSLGSRLRLDETPQRAPVEALARPDKLVV